MLRGVSEVAAALVGVVGLIGAATTTGLPMWKVTAFIGANIVVMETRWEGLWMNCYRQANIRMQCKDYDSLLFLPPELQAARGLMCCSLALSGLGLLVALAGMRCVSCLRGNDRAKTVILMVAGAMQLAASVCVFIPVSWTGHVIIRNFYDPLLIDAQRRELGAALYIGWVTGAFLFASAMLFLCRRFPSDKGSFDVYHPAELLGYKPALVRYNPISSAPSLRSSARPPALMYDGPVGPQLAMPLQTVAPAPSHDGAPMQPGAIYAPGLPESASLLYQGSAAQRSSLPSSGRGGSVYALGNAVHVNPAPYPPTYVTASYQSSFHPVPHTPVFIGYKASRIEPDSHSGSGAGVYI